jgi:hypothetical protein
MVKLLHSSTTVLAAPMYFVQGAAGDGEDVRIGPAVHRVGQEHAAEEHHFGDEEDPHPQRGGVLLLRGGIELLAQRERFL